MSQESISLRQKKHYETIHSDYERHYFDSMSMKYREKFILGPLFKDLDLNGAKVADFMCGSGYNSVALRKHFPTATTTGFDISSSACAAYRKAVGQEAREIDLTSGVVGDGSFDAAIVIVGLHHCISNLEGTIKTISTFLKPGGVLLIVEPSKDFLLEFARTLWYKADKYFDAETEEALSHDKIAKIAEPFFSVQYSRHMGGPGYFLILNSLIFRIPHWLKAIISPPLMIVDMIYNFLPHKLFFPYFVARWTKK